MVFSQLLNRGTDEVQEHWWLYRLCSQLDAMDFGPVDTDDEAAEEAPMDADGEAAAGAPVDVDGEGPVAQASGTQYFAGEAA